MTFELVPGVSSTVAMHKGIWRLSSRLSFTSVGSEVKERNMSHKHVHAETSPLGLNSLTHTIQIQEQNGNELLEAKGQREEGD